MPESSHEELQPRGLYRTALVMDPARSEGDIERGRRWIDAGMAA
jgi:hypothetical protein